MMRLRAKKRFRLDALIEEGEVLLVRDEHGERLLRSFFRQLELEEEKDAPPRPRGRPRVADRMAQVEITG